MLKLLTWNSIFAKSLYLEQQMFFLLVLQMHLFKQCFCWLNKCKLWALDLKPCTIVSELCCHKNGLINHRIYVILNILNLRCNFAYWSLHYGTMIYPSCKNAESVTISSTPQADQYHSQGNNNKKRGE